ncbi:hypothetical protein GTU73_16890 [Rathayibacter sp. VKM Ac-2804]|uniref:hypothetical protein n=1 Tax=Rathayibacter sp. VKM Ac-2804 TaxID=2609257 RepID=UPI00132E81CF|nr:hypothetical protein [Rathayibacter sp. VKM Ac-2804]QHF25504.1 hypothetical protein GTU73_16890 [Rathayibacter sp. VKM Ac-2804]
MTPEKRNSAPFALTMFAIGSLFVFLAAAENRPAWWIVLFGIMLLTTGYSAFVEFRRRRQ